MSSGMTEHFGPMCCICFDPLTPETCAVDVDGVKWDTCPGQCAQEAGIVERPAPSDVERQEQPRDVPTEEAP